MVQNKLLSQFFDPFLVFHHFFLYSFFLLFLPRPEQLYRAWIRTHSSDSTFRQALPSTGLWRSTAMATVNSLPRQTPPILRQGQRPGRAKQPSCQFPRRSRTLALTTRTRTKGKATGRPCHQIRYCQGQTTECKNKLARSSTHRRTNHHHLTAQRAIGTLLLNTCSRTQGW